MSALVVLRQLAATPAFGIEGIQVVQACIRMCRQCQRFQTSLLTRAVDRTEYFLCCMATMPGQKAIAPGDERKPIASVLEASKLAGKATGIIATSEIMHATPADFSSHYPDRKNYDALSKQQVYNGMDVVLGGGSKYLEPAGRKDGENLISSIKALGYDYVTTPAAMKASDSNIFAITASLP